LNGEGHELGLFDAAMLDRHVLDPESDACEKNRITFLIDELIQHAQNFSLGQLFVRVANVRLPDGEVVGERR
jgi:hypothetical protein